MADLPTRPELFENARACIDEARSALSAARDWLRSDWQLLGTPLTKEAGQARVAILESIGEAKDLIDAMKRTAASMKRRSTALRARGRNARRPGCLVRRAAR